MCIVIEHSLGRTLCVFWVGKVGPPTKYTESLSQAMLNQTHNNQSKCPNQVEDAWIYFSKYSHWGGKSNVSNTRLLEPSGNPDYGRSYRFQSSRFWLFQQKLSDFEHLYFLNGPNRQLFQLLQFPKKKIAPWMQYCSTIDWNQDNQPGLACSSILTLLYMRDKLQPVLKSPQVTECWVPCQSAPVSFSAYDKSQAICSCGNTLTPQRWISAYWWLSQ